MKEQTEQLIKLTRFQIISARFIAVLGAISVGIFAGKLYFGLALSVLSWTNMLFLPIGLFIARHFNKELKGYQEDLAKITEASV